MDELKFEEALVRLEEIVRTLEQGEATLDEALKLFEEGVKLARVCHQKLDQAEAKVQILIAEEKQFRVEPLEVDQE